jgi:hypothetical protein
VAAVKPRQEGAASEAPPSTRRPCEGTSEQDKKRCTVKRHAPKAVRFAPFARSSSTLRSGNITGPRKVRKILSNMYRF